jgi:hypothetical protein
LDVIGLQSKAHPREGHIECYWFENSYLGMPRTLFHRIVIPFEPFNSGLNYVPQPEKTSLVVEWLKLGLDDPAHLHGLKLSAASAPDMEATIYLGSAHNWVDITELSITAIGDRYLVKCQSKVKFEDEGVAMNEGFEFEARVAYRGEA